MKLPSLDYLFIHAKESFLRFPLTIISSFIAVIVGIYLVECHEVITNMFPYINLMLCMALGIPLYFCVGIFSEKSELIISSRWVLRMLATVILILLYFTMPDSDLTQNTSLPYIRYGIYNITVHLLVSFIPFLFIRQLNGFWQYNRILFIRILTSILYSGFLYIGLVLALVSLHLLFNIDIHEELYFELFIVIIGIFNTWFFVAGVPQNLDNLEGMLEYPKGLKIFSQFVLLPLLILYLLILYVYGLKIVFLWDWPKGIVAYLITCVSVLGIFTLLLIHPYRDALGNSWIKRFSKAYYFIVFPLVIILFIAIGMRLNDYGITINRYAILMLGIWLSVVCFYFTLGRTNIKFIPISLATLLILISFGPWSIFSVSEKSQVNRLKAILEQSSILQSNQIGQEVIWREDSLPQLHSSMKRTNEGLLNDSIHNEVKSILDYLDDHHGFASIRGWYQQNIDSIAELSNVGKEGWARMGEAGIYMESLGLKYEFIYDNSANSYFTYSSNNDNNAVVVSNYDYLVSFDYYHSSRNTNLSPFTIDGSLYSVNYSFLPTDKLFIIGKTDTIQMEINELIENLHLKYGMGSSVKIPVSEMRLYGSSTDLDFKLELSSIGINKQSDSLQINTLTGNIFIKKKQ